MSILLTFLKKNRRALIESGSVRKYLLYAIGEIVLVVIGILIALQINNWNEYKKERILEDSFLEKISDNIMDDISQYEKVLLVESNYRAQIDSFLIIVRSPFEYKTSDLDKFYKSLWYFERFTPNKGALTNLISSGKINIIENEDLLDSILGYYKTIDEQSASVDEALAAYSRNQIGPYIMNFDFMDSKVVTSKYRTRKSLLEYHQNPAIENLASVRIQLVNTQKNYYEKQMNNAKKLLKQIDEELENNEGTINYL